MSIVIKSEGRFFVFYTTGVFKSSIYFNCRKCKIKLGREYSYIIWKLITAKLLSKKYKTLCCHCNLMQKLVDNSNCPKCKSSLDYIIDRSTIRATYIINCTKCKFSRAVIL